MGMMLAMSIYVPWVLIWGSKTGALDLRMHTHAASGTGLRVGSQLFRILAFGDII